MKALLLGVLLTVGVACSSGPVPAVGVDRDDDIYQYREWYSDPDLVGKLRVGDPQVERTQNGLLRLTLPLHNECDDDLMLLVHVEFLDSAGNSYDDSTGRVSVSVPSGETRRYSVTSLMAKAGDYVVHIGSNE